MLFTVVIATCNRPDRLTITLDALKEAIEANGGDHSVVVVDNGDRYLAEEAVAEFSKTVSFPVQWLRSTPRQRSRAMNAGVEAAQTDWIAFTDDDTLPDKAWLQNAARFAESERYAIFGGRIRHGELDGPLPKWLGLTRDGIRPGHVIFVQYGPREESGPLAVDMSVPYGANFFVHRDLFKQYGGFDERIWEYCGKAALGGEDTEFMIRVQKACETIGFCSEALIVHPVHHERCSLRDQMKLAYRFGWRDPLVFFDPSRPRFEPYRLRLLLLWSARALRDACLGRAPDAALGLLKVCRCWGEMVCLLSPTYRKWAARPRNTGSSAESVRR